MTKGELPGDVNDWFTTGRNQLELKVKICLDKCKDLSELNTENTLTKLNELIRVSKEYVEFIEKNNIKL